MGSVLGFPGVDPLDAAVGARLKRWRETRGMAVDDLALLLHISAEETRRAEAGRAHLTTAQIGPATSAPSSRAWSGWPSSSITWCAWRSPRTGGTSSAATRWTW